MRALVTTFAALILTANLAIAEAENYSKLILGSWLGSRKISVFHTDGTWGVRRNELAPEDRSGRHWSIKGRQLTLIYPSDEGVETAVFAITILTLDHLVLESDGQRQEYRRETAGSK